MEGGIGRRDHTEVNVAGRYTIVKIATVFIALLSVLRILLSCCVIMLYASVISVCRRS